MTKLDQLIEEALSAEDRALMEGVKEPAFFGQLFSQFRGPDAWVNWLTSVAVLAFGLLAVLAGWRFFASPDMAGMVRWGMIAAVAVVVIGMLKLYLLNQMQTDRVIREIKRLELILAARK